MVNALNLLGLVLVGVAAQGVTAASPPTGPATAKAFAAITGARDDARSGDPEQVQRRYEVAREVTDGLAAITPTPPCRPLYEALAAAAHGSILATEGFDRRHTALRLRAERTVAAAITAYEGGVETCPGGIRAAGRPTTGRDPLVAPLAAEAFFGEIQLTVPSGTRQLELLWRGRPALRLHDPPAGTRTLRLPDTSAAGRGTLTLTVRSDRGTTRARTENVWLLPAGARRATVRERRDPGLTARLATLASSFPGFAGIYVHDMATGRTASWNAEARFPAASTVKLGVLAAALDRYGPRPERSPALYDMQALAGWSSNLAANRLLRLLGSGDLTRGRRAVETKLRRLGATRSTYPGAYRVGTARAAVPRRPPLVSARTTTAADLGRVLVVLQAAAAGNGRTRGPRLKDDETAGAP